MKRVLYLIRRLGFLAVMASFVTSCALVEIGVNYSQDETQYGTELQNESVSQTVSGQYSWYLFSTTGLEFGYSKTKRENNELETIVIDESFGLQVDQVITEIENRTVSVGIRQALLPRTARIVPVVSAGYAKQTITSQTIYNFSDTTTNYTTTRTDPELELDSTYWAVMLQFRLSKNIRLNGSMRSTQTSGDYQDRTTARRFLVGLSVQL